MGSLIIVNSSSIRSMVITAYHCTAPFPNKHESYFVPIPRF